jgi:23S rRNA (uridine2552-2'-O)-methyltransferase
VGQQGQVIAIDKQPIAVTAPNLRFYQVDIEAPTLEAGVGPIQAEGIVSDMAPATSGSRVTDQARSARLVQRSLELAQRWLRPGGFWIAKLLEGPELPRLLAQAQPHFQKITTFRPKATRKGSTECFLIGRLYKKVP